MGISNLTAGADDKLARLRGLLDAKREELRQIEEGVSRLSSIHQEIAELEKAIGGGETFLRYIKPGWKPKKIAIQPHNHRGPFKFGELSKIGLSILREASEPMTARDIVRAAMDQHGHDSSDRALLDKVTNSLSAFLKANKGDLVESDGAYPQKWWVIR